MEILKKKGRNIKVCNTILFVCTLKEDKFIKEKHKESRLWKITYLLNHQSVIQMSCSRLATELSKETMVSSFSTGKIIEKSIIFQFSSLCAIFVYSVCVFQI